MPSIRADEHAAMQLLDVASALDAGLPLQSLGAVDPKDERAIVEVLRRRGVILSPDEETVVIAGWHTGRASASLRARADERQRRADFRRTMWSGLRYPFLLMFLLLLASATTASIIGYGFLIGLVIAYGAAAMLVFAAMKGLRRGDERWTRMPVVGSIATGLAELPYLETLSSMYGAGIPLLKAHSAAVAAVPVAAVQNRLRIADSVLQSGRSLTESLAQSLSLHTETRQLLATGEQAGQLEDALHRALSRRREVAARAVTDTTRRFTGLVYGIVVICIVAIVLTFWTNFYGSLGKIGR